MALLRQLLKPLGQASHLFFKSQVKLRLRGGMRVELVERDGRRRVSPEQLAERQRQVELSLMVGELAQCLDADPDIRPELRHLAYLETMLRQQGLDALQVLPLEVLRKALDQFEGLVSNWSPRGLATLRSKMAVALHERGLADGVTEASTPMPLDEPST